MKRLGLLSIIGCSVSGVAIAAGVDCSVIPTCTELGYTKSVADCEGQIILRCPFEITNDNAVFCQDKSSASAPSEPAIGQGCDAVGDILYNDFNCYDTAPSGKTAIGVVFDTTNKLAIGLTRASSTMTWWSSYEDVSGLENCTDESTVKTTCGTSGKTNSAALVAAGYTDDASYAAGYCYNQTTGGLAKGDWFLPSAKELYTVYTNKSTIDTAITSAGGTTISSGYYRSSTESSSSHAWVLRMDSGTVYNYDKSTVNPYVRCAVSYADGGNGDDSEESCSSDYSLDTCPTNGVCSECGGKQKLESCANGYSVSGNTCVAATCAGQTSNTGCKTYTTCLSGTTNYYSCTACNSGYTKSGTKCVAATCAGQTSTTGCKTYTTCLSGTTTYYVCSACNSGYTLSASKCPKTSCSGQTSTTGCKTYSGTCLSGTTTYYLCTECYTGYKLSSNKCTKTCTYTSTTVLTDEYCQNLKQGYNHADSCVRGSASGEKTYYQCICSSNMSYGACYEEVEW